MKPTAALVLLLFLFGWLTGGCEPASTPGDRNSASSTEKPVELYVLAAASLSDAMYEAKQQYEAVQPGVHLILVFGSSGALRKQIEQGAPADLFLSAGPVHMRALANQGYIDQQRILAGNQLVLITPRRSALAVHSLPELQQPAVKRVAIGQPDTVPAGQYAKQALSHAGIWNAVQQKAVFAKDVRQVLTYVETGNVDAGFVYRSDARMSDKVRVEAPADFHEPIVYPVGIVKATRHHGEALAFYQWLQSRTALDIFQKYGFLNWEN